MAFDPEGVVQFKSEGTTYRLFFGMRARKNIETHYDLPFFRALQKAMPALTSEDIGDPAKALEAGLDLSQTDVAKLFEFALQKFHPDLGEDGTDDLIDHLGLERTTELLGDALAASMVSEEDAGAAKKNPPVASRKKKTGSPALQNG
jgi:hypothetical protein